MIAALAGAFLSPPASAQPDRFGQQIQELAEILGRVHYMRNLCVGNEDMVWRDAMMELLRLEEPSRAERKEMTRRFNEGYHAARDRFPECDAKARHEMKRLSSDGARLSSRLARKLKPKGR
ncbi:MAG: TIGR02301 family protein [Alphaproteobacteria bacterium]